MVQGSGGSMPSFSEGQPPADATKRDAIPGRLTRLWFRAERTGRFDVLCAENCGAGHFRMRAVLRVVSRAEFDYGMCRVARSVRLRTLRSGISEGRAGIVLPNSVCGPIPESHTTGSH